LNSNSPGGQNAVDVVLYAKANNGAARSGYKGGSHFANDGRAGGQILPTHDSNNLAITYKEYDVNPYQKGFNRGTQRVVIGSDGKSYYTSDHYKTFTEIK
jgi:guanyl-specific ribonuclease Sa